MPNKHRYDQPTLSCIYMVYRQQPLQKIDGFFICQRLILRVNKLLEFTFGPKFFGDVLLDPLVRFKFVLGDVVFDFGRTDHLHDLPELVAVILALEEHTYLKDLRDE